jgi:hypothetical protein
MKEILYNRINVGRNGEKRKKHFLLPMQEMEVVVLISSLKLFHLQPLMIKITYLSAKTRKCPLGLPKTQGQ